MSNRDWASLEKGLLRDIFVRLPTDADAANFRFVCGGWRVAAGAGTPVPRPWMILKSADDDSAPHAIVRPTDRRHRTRNRSPAVVRVDSVAVTREECPPAVIRGASRGWLAVNEGERLLLRDPISRAEVPLPTFDEPAYKLFDVFLSDDPLAVPGRWTAFAFFRWDDVNTQHMVGDVLAFCRPGDAEWARVDPVFDDGSHGHVHHGHQAAGQQQQIQVQRYRGLEFFAGRPYVLLTNPSRLAVCDVEARRLVVSTVIIYTPPAGPEYGYQECLVECGGDLLVVQVARRDEFTPSPFPWYCPGSHRFERHRAVYSAKAFRVKLDVDGGMPVEALRAASTGDYAVFVAPRGHAFALPASGFPAVRAGCVYFFAVDYRRNVQGMVVVDLAADPTRHDRFVPKLPLAGNWHVLSWFCPRLVLDTTTPRRRRRRCSMLGVRSAFPFSQF